MRQVGCTHRGRRRLGRLDCSVQIGDLLSCLRTRCHHSREVCVKLLSDRVLRKAHLSRGRRRSSASSSVSWSPGLAEQSFVVAARAPITSTRAPPCRRPQFVELGQQHLFPTTPEVCQPACVHACGHADARNLCPLQAACLARGPCTRTRVQICTRTRAHACECAHANAHGLSLRLWLSHWLGHFWLRGTHLLSGRVAIMMRQPVVISAVAAR